MNIHTAINIANELVHSAYSQSHLIHNEQQLSQYYSLIELAIKTLINVKKKNSLAIDQDFEVTFQIVKLLIKETTNIDMAENYLSSLKERLQNNSGLINEKMFIEYWLIYEIPQLRQSKFHSRLAINKSEELVEYLRSLEHTSEIENWIYIFQFVNCLLNVNIGKNRKAIQRFNELLKRMDTDENKQIDWYNYILLNFINFMLEHRINVPIEINNKLSEMTVEQIGYKFYTWKLLLELVQLIYSDENITNKLNEFKSFFHEYKNELNSTESYVHTLEINSRIKLEINSPVVFQYQNIKILLLFFQSISYLVNCYDEKANFSTKFLPKVIQTTERLISNIGPSGDKQIVESLTFWNLQVEFYDKLLEITHFYQIWETQILNINQDNNMEELLPTLSGYNELINITNLHKSRINDLDEMNKTLEMYDSVIQNREYSIEMKLMSLINMYVILTSLISQDHDRQNNMIKCGVVWSKLMKVYRNGSFDNNEANTKNTLWDCTICIIWIMSHLEPFTWNPLPCTSEEKNYYLNKLKLYYLNNMVKTKGQEEEKKGDNGDVNDYKELINEKYKVKKSLLVRIILNYMGGKLIETNLNKICEISSVCFQMCRKQNLNRIRYVIGLWHLMNCTIAMKPKDVAYTRAKLENIVRNIVKENDQLST